MSKKFTVAFATLSITAENIEEALQKAKAEARVIQVTDDEAYDPVQVHVADIGYSATGSDSDLSGGSQDTRSEPTVVENEVAAAGFIEGKSYYSETNTWLGTIGSRLDHGAVSVSVTNLNDGHTEVREFRLTANKNLRSTRGNIVLYANKPAND